MILVLLFWVKLIYLFKNEAKYFRNVLIVGKEQLYHGLAIGKSDVVCCSVVIEKPNFASLAVTKTAEIS